MSPNDEINKRIRQAQAEYRKAHPEIAVMKIMDKMARLGQWSYLQNAYDYAVGLVEAHDAQSLTPDMFKEAKS